MHIIETKLCFTIGYFDHTKNLPRHDKKVFSIIVQCSMFRPVLLDYLDAPYMRPKVWGLLLKLVFTIDLFRSLVGCSNSFFSAIMFSHSKVPLTGKATARTVVRVVKFEGSGCIMSNPPAPNHPVAAGHMR